MHVTLLPDVVLAHQQAITKIPPVYSHYQSDFKVCTISLADFMFATDNPSKYLLNFSLLLCQVSHLMGHI